MPKLPKVWIKPETWIFKKWPSNWIKYQYRRNGQVWSCQQLSLKLGWSYVQSMTHTEFRNHMRMSKCTRL